jgi:hypothetical protein
MSIIGVIVCFSNENREEKAAVSDMSGSLVSDTAWYSLFE